MPAIKTDDKVSERLLSIDWGQPPSERRPAVSAAAKPAPQLKGATVSVRIDEVFHHINAYRAMLEADVPRESMLARSLIAQSNAVFNQAFVNLESRYEFSRVFADAPLAQPRPGVADITDLVIDEVMSLQTILNAA
jgi:hypothetical protein